MTGKPNPDFNDLLIEFEAYAHVYEPNKKTNTVKARTTGAIALNATCNSQRGHYFMSSTTGKRLSRKQWTKLPMPNGVIVGVEKMAEKEKQSIFDRSGPKFE